METGHVHAVTALSNPMEYYASVENIRLSSKEVEGGYIINGLYPFDQGLH